MFYQRTIGRIPDDDRHRDAARGNTGIWWDCAYRWVKPTEFTCDEVDAKDPSPNKDCCYTFGGNTDVGEHCNVFLYYYPKVDTDIFCL